MAPKRGKKFPGAELPWVKDMGSGEIDTAPTPRYPTYEIPDAEPLSEREKEQVEFYRSLRTKFNDGPYYAILGPTIGSVSSVSSSTGTWARMSDLSPKAARKRQVEARKRQEDAAKRASYDPFRGMDKYSKRFHKKHRKMPDLKGGHFVVNFFPKELWATVQPSYKKTNVEDELPSYKQAKRVYDEVEDEEDDDDEREIEDFERRAPKRRRRELDGEDGKRTKDDEDDEEEEAENIEEDEEEDEELVDDDFSEDDDEMGGDYNAEQYFDAGDADDDGFGDGGGDDDAY